MRRKVSSAAIAAARSGRVAHSSVKAMSSTAGSASALRGTVVTKALACARAGVQNDQWWIAPRRSEEHTSELQSLMRISYAVFCLKKKKHKQQKNSSMESATTEHHKRRTRDKR